MKREVVTVVYWRSTLAPIMANPHPLYCAAGAGDARAGALSGSKAVPALGALQRIAVVALLFGLAGGCGRAATTTFDPRDQSQCSIAFQFTSDRAGRSGDKSLSENMAFRAKWAEREALRRGHLLTAEQKKLVLAYLQRNMEIASDATIACRSNENRDPRFPASKRYSGA